jgi:hypothetical protein
MKALPPLMALFLLLAPAAMAAWTPPDIAAYVQRRTACNHWGGEEPYDKARAAEITKAMAKLNCATIEADEKTLRRRYRHAPAQLEQIRAARDALL